MIDTETIRLPQNRQSKYTFEQWLAALAGDRTPWGISTDQVIQVRPNRWLKMSSNPERVGNWIVTQAGASPEVALTRDTSGVACRLQRGSVLYVVTGSNQRIAYVCATRAQWSASSPAQQ
jgi:hypothetical protein